MDLRIRIPSMLARLAIDRAGSAQQLAKLTARWVEQYATGETAQALGGRARAERMTPEQRSESARRAGLASQAARRAAEE